MKQTLNDRVSLLKTTLDLGVNEFAMKAGISPGTIWNIENGGNVAPKTLKAIITSFNVNPEWLKIGKGEMFLEGGVKVNEASNPWKDAMVIELKEEVTYLREVVKMLAGGGKGAGANFLKALDVANVPLYLLNRGTHSGANAVS